MLKKILLLFSILLALIGITWFGQGIGVIHGSIMTGDAKWAVIGALLVLIAVVLFFASKKRVFASKKRVFASKKRAASK